MNHRKTSSGDPKHRDVATREDVAVPRQSDGGAQNANATTCAIYARCAMADHAATSIAKQISECKEYANRMGWTVANGFVVKDVAKASVSGHRDGLKVLLSAASIIPRPFDYVVTCDVARFSRNLADVMNVCAILGTRGVEVHFVSPELNSGDPEFQRLSEIERFFSGKYAISLRKNMHVWYDDRVQMGAVVGRCYGYTSKVIARRGNATPCAVLAIDDEEAEVIRRIFGMYSIGYGFADIAKILNVEKIPSPRARSRSSSRWYAVTVKNILGNERYHGVIVWNRRSYSRDVETGKVHTHHKSASQYRQACKPELRIIPEDLWERVQRILKHTTESSN